MGRNAYLDEAKDAQWPLPEAVWPGFNKLKLTPTVGAVIDRLKPEDQGRGETLIRTTVKGLLIAGIMDGEFREVYDAIGELMGYGTPVVVPGTPVPQAGRGTPVGRRA